MLRAVSRARPSPPLPFLRSKHPFLAALLRWHFVRAWLYRRSWNA
jgi:hypothetical protein